MERQATETDDLIFEIANSLNYLERVVRGLLDSHNHKPRMGFREAASFLGLTESHLRKLVLKKEVPVMRIGRKLLFSKKDLEEWLHLKEDLNAWLDELD